MNKLEANVSLFVITFFAAIQYVFLKNIPSSVSHFAYLFITNLIGFILIFIVFFGELFRLDRKQIGQSFLLSLELFGYNIFMLMGSTEVDTTVSACVLSAYFIFIPIYSYVLFRQKPSKNTIAALCVATLGLFVFTGLDAGGLLNINVLFLWIGDLFFAAYILTTEKMTARSNPSILAMGQLFFNFIFALIVWVAQALYTGEKLEIPSASEFWGSVLFICFFIRGLYGVIQIYAQRYVSAFNTSLIFSSEILMTIIMSPILSRIFHTEKETITAYKLVGGILIVCGILVADPAFTGFVSRRFSHAK